VGFWGGVLGWGGFVLVSAVKIQTLLFSMNIISYNYFLCTKDLVFSASSCTILGEFDITPSCFYS
jgi:hypothetical protein